MMSKRKSKHDENSTLKAILRTITIIFIAITVIKKLAELAEKMNFRSKVTEFVGEDMEAALEKWEKRHASPQPVNQQVIEPVAAPARPEASKTVPKPRQVKPAAKVAQGDDIFELNDRQEKIFEMVNHNGEVTMQLVSDHINDVSERTLRRDMNKLEKLGLIERFGKTKDSVYKLKK